METQKIKYLENEKSFFSEIKNIFHIFEVLSLVINKNLLKKLCLLKLFQS